MFPKQSSTNVEVRRTPGATVAFALISLALLAASCGSGETIGSRGGVDDVTAQSTLDETSDDATVDEPITDDGTDTSGDADPDSSAVEGTEVEGTEVEGTEVEGSEPDDVDDQADSPSDSASGPNTKLLTEPQTTAQIHEILKEIGGDGGLGAANKFTFFPEVPIPDGGRFFGYETDVVTASIGGGALGNTTFEYFFDGSYDEVEAAFFAEMEAAGWDMKAEDIENHYEVAVPSRQFELDLRIYDAGYRGSTLAILRFFVNGEAHEDVGNPEVWEGLAGELGIVIPETAILNGGGAASYREETEKEESNPDPNVRTGDFVKIFFRPGESGDLTEYMEAFGTYAEGQGYQATIGISEMSLIKDGEATTYVFDRRGFWVTKELK